MRKFIFTILILLLPLICFSQSGWYTQNSGTTNMLNDIFFIDGKTGWAVGANGTVVKTVNGGFSWYTQTSNTTLPLYKVQFINSNTGWAIGGAENPPPNPFCMYSGVILKTTNGGVTWAAASAFGAQLNDIGIIDTSTFYVVGESIHFQCFSMQGALGKTTTGGNNWAAIFNPTSSSYMHKSVSFINSNTGYYTAIYSSDTPSKLRKILKTTNGGLNWISRTTDSIPGFSSWGEGNFLRFFNESTGYYINGNFLKTTNAGDNWIKFDSLSVYGMSKFSFLNQNTGYLVGQGKVVKTFNGGVNWITNTGTTFTGLSSICAVDTNQVWACGTNGKIVYGGDAIAADTASIRYMPLKIGNSWTYRNESNFGEFGYNKVTILGDSIINGVTYYRLSQSFPYLGGKLITLDSLTGNLYSYTSSSGCPRFPNGFLLDSLGANLFDLVSACPGSNTNGKCIGIGDEIIFGQNRLFKYLTSPNYEAVDYNHKYIQDFGITFYQIKENTHYNTGTLKGCVLNGVLYGDTTVYSKLSGTVKFSDNNNPASNGYVKAIKLEQQSGNIITLDSVQIFSGGNYLLTKVPSGPCYIVAYPNSEKNADFVPTYYPSSINWQNAVVVNVSSTQGGINISVFRKTSSMGMYSIDGMVMPQTNNQSGIKDAIVYIKQGDIYRDFFTTGSAGSYNLNQLGSGSFEIISNRLGYINSQRSVSIVNSNLSNVNFVLEPAVGIHQVSTIVPDKFSLYQNYPNPFNPVTNIKFDIQKNSFVKLKVYDIVGKEITVLVNENKSAGSYVVDFDAVNLTSGVYFYRIETENFTETKRMIILK